MEQKKYHHGDLKQALIEAGLAILETDGLPGLSLRACAARTGVSHAAPKNHFGSLKGLITAIAAEGFCRHAQFMRSGLMPGASRTARLQAAMVGYVRFSAAHPHLFELMFSPNYPDFTDETLRQNAQASYAVLRDISTGLDWDKAATPDGQVKTEMMLWSMVHGYALLSISGQFSKGGATGAPPYPIEQIMPDFGYLA